MQDPVHMYEVLFTYVPLGVIEAECIDEHLKVACMFPVELSGREKILGGLNIIYTCTLNFRCVFLK